ncbi:uncharacterized protein [Onthophagus taurus]|uniref:uncharacterized protein n=1 Tax=Onthophagus taurus TaxID=166361 RepID=UPI0039BEC76B
MEHLNRLGQCEFLPKKKVSDLHLHTPYPIVAAKRIPSRAWPMVIVELEAGFIVFLPKRIAEVISDAEIVELSEMCLPNSVLEGGFELAKWTSNNLQIIRELTLTSTIDRVDLGKYENTRTLGLLWDPTSDEFRYEISEGTKYNKINKRTILSDIAQVFDPLGLLCPVTINAKIILQEIWQAGLNWDEVLPNHIHTSWVKFRQQLPYLNSIRVPRHISLQYSRSLELHGFSDASTKAYGACIYLRSCGVDGDVISRLICAKSRVAPLKQITVPRLELMGALLLADLMSKVKNALIVDILKTIYWTDSSVVLGWLSIEPSQLQIFVGNRVTKILERTNSNEWRYVSTKDNPADPISRGVNVRELSNLEKYWLGPAWLIQNENMWPVRKFQTENLPEKRVVLNLTTNVNQLIPFSKFSSLIKLQRIVAFVFRFKNNCKGKLRLKGPLNADELRVALEYLVKCSQRETFPEELQLLESDKCLPKENRLTNLSAFLDENGIIRVGGRLSNSDYAFDKKFPIIISGKHTLTRLIFEAEHKFLFHAGPQQLLASIRERFWPIGGRSIAKHIARKCITCCQVNPKFTQPRMGNLPKNRITPAPPFHTTGVDYAGQFLLKNKRGRGAKTSKCYNCLFVCFVTRAIHLELLSELTSESFLSALRRFAARRGKPQKMYSDNGTNFVGANRELEELSKFLINNSNELTDMINACNINWSFIPPKSPHFGGIWEAGVKSVKFHLRRVASNASFRFEDFYTLLVQIEAILNSRPLTPLSSDPNDLAPLTPAHFLIGKQLISPPDPDLSHVGENRLSHFQHVQQHFWARWYREYLAELQRRHKWTKSDSNLKIGQLVLIREDNLPTLFWKTGRIVELHKGTHNIARVASVRTSSGIIKRAVVKLCCLPVV